MRKIYIEVTEERIKGGGVVIGAALSHDDIELHIKFDDSWAGLTKRVIWQNAYGENTVYQNLAGTAAGEHIVLIPFAPKEFEGKAFFGIKGFTTEERTEGDEAVTVETKAVMTARTEFVVLPSLSDDEAEAAQTPNATLAEEMQADIAELQENMAEAQGDIEDLKTDKVDKADGFGLVKHTTSNGVLTTQQKDGDSVNIYTKDKADELLEEKYDVPENGIPKSDLSSGVKASLDRADSAIQDISGKVDKVEGKGLSTNDYTDEDKAKLEYVTDNGNEFFVDGSIGVAYDINIGTNKATPANIRFRRDGSPKTMQDYLDEKADATDVTAIEGKIPSQASSSNKLADKDFVNSSIATETAHYISNNGEPFISVSELNAYQGTVTNNDYAFVTGTDGSGNTYYDRYKASVSGSTVTWAKEYRLNNSSFTAEQWAAISSGITSALVNQITENQQAILTMAQSIANKVDKETGKGLSTNDYDNTDKAKVDKITVTQFFGTDIISFPDEDEVKAYTFAAENILSRAMRADEGDIREITTSTIKMGNQFANRTPDNIVFYPENHEEVTLQDYLDEKQDTLVSGENIKTINNESVLGGGNLTLQKPWRKMYVITLTAARNALSFGHYYGDKITGDDTFNLSRARLIIECPPNANSTNPVAFLNLYSEDIVNVSDAYQNYGVENAISTTQTRFSEIEIVTDDDFATYTITSTDGIGQLSFGQIRANYGAVKITHKRLQSIRIFANGAGNTFPVGTKFILYGIEK